MYNRDIQPNCERKARFGLVYDTSDHVCLDLQNCLYSTFTDYCTLFLIYLHSYHINLSNLKYVIDRSLLDISHIVPGIIPLSISHLGINSANRSGSQSRGYIKVDVENVRY